ncbi:MAG: cupin domain-containing protein [Solirubrobacterales bacterium]
MRGDREEVSVLDLDGPRAVRFDDLRPAWGKAHRSEQAGYFRWLVSYVGGPPGWLEEHPESGLIGDRSVLGVMGLPAGQRQFGLHRHPTTEIYLILAGRVESIEAEGQRQMLGPLDCLYIPPAAPHCVRAVGDEDVLLLYAHDDHERLGESKYVEDDDPTLGRPEPHPEVVARDDLAPWWGAPGATEAGQLRWSVSWVGGADPRLDHNPERSARHDGVALGMTSIEAAGAAPEETWDAVRYLYVHAGTVAVEGRPELAPLRPRDVLVVPPGCPCGLRPLGVEPARLVWLHRARPSNQTTSRSG